jgi:hypothetical protein
VAPREPELQRERNCEQRQENGGKGGRRHDGGPRRAGAMCENVRAILR